MFNELFPFFLQFFTIFFCFCCGAVLGSRGIVILTVTTVLFNFFYYSFCLFFIIKNKVSIYFFLKIWFFFEGCPIFWSFFFDSIGITMLCVINLVSVLVHLYSFWYLKGDPHCSRFFIFLSLFTFFMLFLVLSQNFLQLFVGWEGVGLSSYLLISFWFTRQQACKSGLKALILNKIGDCGVLLGICFFFHFFGTSDFSSLYVLSSFASIDFVLTFGNYLSPLVLEVNDFIMLLFVLGVVSKSAQLGLHTWLADAMEGPTPVSALLHAATMVTAGIFLLLRCSFFLEKSLISSFLCCFLGAFTALFAGIVACVQYDIKKIIAYSTCSQLGFMCFCCGLFKYDAAFFHLINHAFFKALLFLTAGVFIHNFYDQQDIRYFSAWSLKYPFFYLVFLVGSLSLVGFPFSSGFFSKDIILESSYFFFSDFYNFLFFIIKISTFLTCFYSFRLLFQGFFCPLNVQGLAKRVLYTNLSKKIEFLPFFFRLIFFCIFLLFLGAICSGFFFYDTFSGMGSEIFFFSNGLVLKNLGFFFEFSSKTDKYLPLVLFILGFFLAFLSKLRGKLWVYLFSRFSFFVFFYKFFVQRWFFDLIFSKFFGITSNFLGFFYTLKLLDRGFLELLGSRGFYYLNNYFFFNYFIFFSNSFLSSIIFFMSLGFFFLFIVLIYFFFLNSLHFVFFLFFFLHLLLVDKLFN